MWEQILKIPGNDHCCDCGIVNPRWASINLGVTLCIGKLLKQLSSAGVVRDFHDVDESERKNKLIVNSVYGAVRLCFGKKKRSGS
jgi:hypothetical protein